MLCIQGLWLGVRQLGIVRVRAHGYLAQGAPDTGELCDRDNDQEIGYLNSLQQFII